MPFPFMPLGALLALAVLSAALAVFGAALKALDWTIDAARGSMLSGVVSGIRNWDAAPRRSATGSPNAPEPREALGPRGHRDRRGADGRAAARQPQRRHSSRRLTRLSPRVAAIAASLAIALAVSACSPASADDARPRIAVACAPVPPRAQRVPPPVPPRRSRRRRPTDSPGWWREQVFYEVFVRSFADSNGDGVGDLAGADREARLPQRRRPGDHDDLGVSGCG